MSEFNQWNEEGNEEESRRRARAESTVRMPALLLLLTAVLGLLLNSLFIGYNFIVPAEERKQRIIELTKPLFAQDPAAQAQFEKNLDVDSPQNYVSYVIGIIAAIVIILGSLSMARLGSKGLSYTAAILSMIPCTAGCCCLVGLPLGIWALISLNNVDVQWAFAQGSRTRLENFE